MIRKSSSLFVLCTLWIVITAISDAIAMAYGFSFLQDSKSTWHEYFLRGLFVCGFLSGLGQWVLIKSRLKRTEMWIVINILGIPLGLILGHYLYSGFISLVIPRKEVLAHEWIDIAYPFAVISVAGIVLGTLQWLVLKNKVGFAYWWIPVSVLSWNIGLYLPYVVFGSLNLGLWTDSWSISGAIFGVMLGGMVGTIGSITIGSMLTNSNRVIKLMETEESRNAS